MTQTGSKGDGKCNTAPCDVVLFHVPSSVEEEPPLTRRPLLDRIVEASNASVVNAYETRIDKLERQKIVLQERLDKSIPPKGRLEDCIELALGFLSSPWNIYKNGGFVMRQTVLRLAFAEPLKYSQNGVYGTPELSFPFKFLGGFLGQKSEMVL
jgi:site-specific DNA recombinase